MSMALGLPQRIAAQIATILIAAVLLAHLLTAAMVWLFQPDPPRALPPVMDAVRIATTARLLDSARAADRRDLLSGAPTWGLRFDTMAGPIDARAGEAASLSGMLRDLVRRELAPSGLVMAVPADPGNIAAVAVQLTDGNWLLAQVEESHASGAAVGVPWPLVSGLFSLAAALTAASLWASQRLAAPLRRFASALDGLQPDDDGAVVPETGPWEISRAAAAINRLQDRVRRLLAERSRMLAAISHDLRAPLARLRLRVESLDRSPTQAEIAQDLGRMETLLASALAYLRGRAIEEPLEEVDLPSLIQTVLDRHQDLGHEVAYEGPAHLVHRCRPVAIERAIDNLVANATQFGTRVDVLLRLLPNGDVGLDVIDDGPGIPVPERDRVLGPFYRGDAERNPGRAGFGLGLSIVADIVSAEGGRLELLEREPHGLVVRILLPQGG